LQDFGKIRALIKVEDLFDDSCNHSSFYLIILDTYFHINNKCLYLSNSTTIKVIDINLEFVAEQVQ